MGLEMTELIMACEEEFGIDFREHERTLNRIETVGDLHRSIVFITRPCETKGCPNVPVFFSLRRALVDNLSLNKTEFSLDTRLLDLLPANAWFQRWPALQASLAYELPSPYPIRPMLHPAALVGVSLLGATILEVMALSLMLDTGSWGFGHLVILLAPLLLPLVAVIVAVSRSLAPLEYHLPAETIRELVGRVTRHTHAGLQSGGTPWTDASIWDELKKIISERLDVDKDRITPDTDFLKDLGAN